MIGTPGLKLVARRALGRLVRWRARRRSEPMGTPAGATLVFAPHQDDCALGCAGLILSRTRAGLPVHVAYVTDGSASHRGHPSVSPQALAAMRAAEASAACALLGVPASGITFLGAPDGELPRLAGHARAALVREIAALIARTGASEVCVTAAEDGSSEHAAANAMVREAAGAGTRPRILEYPIWSIWNPRRLNGQVTRAARISRVGLGPEALSLKAEALRCFRSQYLPLDPWDEPALPRGFMALFESDEEFFLEY